MHPLELPVLYRLWQQPFAAKKLAPVLERLGSLRGVRVLDVGCGPGTNAPALKDADFLGIDVSTEYIADAKRRYGPHFQVADATKWKGDGQKPFDVILINSILHHLDDAQVDAVLENVAPLLAPNGTLQVLELVKPRTYDVPRLLAKLDRGHYARRVEHWESLVARRFRVTHKHPYMLTGARFDLWAMVHLEGVRA